MDFTTPNTRQMANEAGSSLFQSNNTTSADFQGFVLDRAWTRQAFLLSDSELGDKVDIANRYWSSASAKFTDTRLGCNIGVNSRPQFTRYSDVRVKGILSGRQDVTVQDTGGNHGMGRYYSEAIDDTGQTIYLRFGVPQFNSLTSFFAKAFDPDWVAMVRTGRGSSTWRELGVIAGTVIGVVAMPALSAVIYGAKAISWFFGKPTSKFYTLKPTMFMYWSAVGMLVNTIAANSGILPPFLADESSQKLGSVYKFDNDLMNELHKLMPDILTSNNGFDPFAFANKAQRLSNQYHHDLYNDADKASETAYVGLLKKHTGDGRASTYYLKKEDSGFFGSLTGVMTLPAFIDKSLKFGYYTLEEKKEDTPRTEMKPNIDPKTGNEKPPGWWTEFGNYFDAELRSGSQFAVFKVNSTGSPSESFSNTSAESDLSQKFNGVSSQARQARFTFADGNIVGGPVGDILGKIGTAVTDVASGILSGVTFGISDALKGLAGGGYIDIPQTWQSSSARLPTASYTMKLVTPYGNPISRLQNIYIPLAMILAGGLPLSTGKQSYSSPFLVQLYDQGRCQIQLGLIESISITRGTSNLPFNKQGKPLAVDVTFSIKDLSSIMHMPVSTGSLFGALQDAVGTLTNAAGSNNPTLDQDNILVDYLAVLAGQDIYSQIYPLPKAKLRLAKLLMQNEKLLSPAYWSAMFHESATSGIMKYLTLGSVSLLEAVVTSGSNVPGAPGASR